MIISVAFQHTRTTGALGAARLASSFRAPSQALRKPAIARTAAQPSSRIRFTSPRAQQVAEAATSGASAGQQSPASEEDIVVVAACRTPSCRCKKGALAKVEPIELMTAVLKGVIDRSGVSPGDVGDICLASVFPNSSKRGIEARQAMFLAGFPVHVPIYTVNRQCAAGLQAIANVAAGINAGYYDIGIAGGIEHFTTNPLIWEGSESMRAHENPLSKDVMLPLGITAENIAEQFGIPREEQDRIAARSHAKAAAAQAEGRFDAEIVPIEVTLIENGVERKVVVDKDDGIRPESTQESLGKLKPYFKAGGSVTAGNACQNTDCAAAVLLMKRKEAKRRNLPVMGTLRSIAVKGVQPAIMGTGPAVAIPEALRRAGLSKDDIDVFELNEAFASQTAYCMRKLELPEDRVNPSGGGIALGHPAGATGARLAVTLLHDFARRSSSGSGSSMGSVTGSQMGEATQAQAGMPPPPVGSDGKGSGKEMLGVIATCTGAGMGAAAVFSSGDYGLGGSRGSSSGSAAGSGSNA